MKKKIANILQKQHVVGGTTPKSTCAIRNILALKMVMIIAGVAPSHSFAIAANSTIEKGENQTQQTINGRVYDENNRPLRGATVTEKGTNNMVKTDASGHFSIKPIHKNAVLRFNFIGYQSIEKASVEGMEVILRPQLKDLDEVVVTGFQKINKEKFTGSVSTIDKSNIDRSGYVDVSKMLQGAAAGVSVQNVSGTLGTSAKIRIRGNSSISANQEPLYVVNGVPITSPSGVSVNQLYSGDAAAVLGSAIAGLNAQDIEDIVILKDGAATSLYGTRAANGVISITTKTGKADQNNINYLSAISYGLKPRINDFNLMNSQEEMALYKRLWNSGYFSEEVWPTQTGAYTDSYRRYGLREITSQEAYNELERATTVNTNWFDVLFRNNIVQEHNISFSGGSKKNTYYVSGNYTHDNGQAKGFDAKRYTVDFRNVINVTDRFSLDINANYAFRDQNTPGVLNSTMNDGAPTRRFEINPTLFAIGTSRAMYPFNSDGSRKYYLNNLAPFNILEELEENFINTNAQEFRIMVKPTIKITKNLTYEFTGALRRTTNSFDHIATERSNYARAHRVTDNDALREKNTLLWRNPNDPNAIKESILQHGGILQARSDKALTYNLRNQFSFDKKWSDHQLNSMIGSEIRSELVDRISNKNYGYLHHGGRTTNPSSLAYIKAVQDDDKLFISSFQKENFIGLYTAHQYSYLNRYNIETGVRMDGSNMFGKSIRSKFLPNYSLGLSWNLNKEVFFERINRNNRIDFIKIRASHALRGNTIQTSPQLNPVPINLNRIDLMNSTNGIDITIPELYSLTWEKDYVTNIGIDFGLFRKINASVEYYDRANKGLIRPAEIAMEEGFKRKDINWASMSNKGIDLTFAYNDLLSSATFKWDVNLIYGYVKNQITHAPIQSIYLYDMSSPTGFGLQGHPLEGLFAYKFAGLGAQGQPQFYRGEDVVSKLTITEQDRDLIEYMGSRAPTSTGSFSSNFGFKGFDLRFFLTFAAGHKVFRNEIASRFYNDASSKSADLNYMWQTFGNEHVVTVPGLISQTQQEYLRREALDDELAYNRSTDRVVDASHIRLSEIMLSYNLKNALPRIKSVKTAKITLAANNLTFWGSKRLRGVDPDVYITGVNLPNPRTFSLRLFLGF